MFPERSVFPEIQGVEDWPKPGKGKHDKQRFDLSVMSEEWFSVLLFLLCYSLAPLFKTSGCTMVYFIESTKLDENLFETLINLMSATN